MKEEKASATTVIASIKMSYLVMDAIKDRALRMRLSDNGWGHAFAHLIPFYGIYYGLSRRTITPLAWQLLGSFVVGFTIGIFMGAAGASDSSIEATGLLLGFVITPVLAKQGIDSARIYAKTQLRIDNTSNDRSVMDNISSVVLQDQRKSRTEDGRDIQSVSDNSGGFIGLKFGDQAKGAPSEYKPYSQSPFADLQFGARAKAASPEPEWQQSTAPQSTKPVTPIEEENLTSPATEPPTSTPETQFIGSKDKTSNTKEEVIKGVISDETSSIDALEVALKRYQDMYEKGLIEKDEYDALRKRELGL